MANAYAIEKHPQKEQIIKDILAGKPNTEVAANYGQLSTNAVRRYKEDVLLPDLIREHSKTIANCLEDLIQKLETQARDTEELSLACKKAMYQGKDLKADRSTLEIAKLYLGCCKELRESIRDLAAYRTGNQPNTAEVNITISNPITINQIIGVMNKIPDDELREEIIEELSGISNTN